MNNKLAVLFLFSLLYSCTESYPCEWQASKEVLEMALPENALDCGPKSDKYSLEGYFLNGDRFFLSIKDDQGEVMGSVTFDIPKKESGTLTLTKNPKAIEFLGLIQPMIASIEFEQSLNRPDIDLDSSKIEEGKEYSTTFSATINFQTKFKTVENRSSSHACEDKFVTFEDLKIEFDRSGEVHFCDGGLDIPLPRIGH